MLRPALIGVAAATVAVTALLADEALPNRVRHHRVVVRSHVCRPIVEHWDPVWRRPWPPIAYVGAAFGPATGAATGRHCGYWPECIRYPHHRLHCTYPY